jgi:predicted short-subunit dehydrogenase-like oxidoreductase (DUF2520 family)
MHNYYNIAIIGAGNLAWHLGPALENNGHRISLIYNRNRKNAQHLIDRLYRAERKKNLNFSSDYLDLIIIAVSDNAIKDIASEIITPENCLLVHTSGCQSMDVLERSAATSIGVFYPLQSFTRGVKINFTGIPVFLESSSRESMNKLIRLAKGMTKKIYQLTGTQRRALHLSAVMSTNFSNYLFILAKKIMEKHGIDFDLLEPVTLITMQKIFSIGPEAGQTGPAIRDDNETMDLHLEMMDKDEDLLEIYSMMSKHIRKLGKKPGKG